MDKETKDEQQQHNKDNLKSEGTAGKGVEKKVSWVSCIYCPSNHDIDDCAEFAKLVMKDKKAFMFRKRLCFSCFKEVSPSHTSKTCKNKRKCTACNEPHPTAFHVSPKEDSTDAPILNAATGCDVDEHSVGGKEINQVVSLCIVPVKVRHHLNPEHQMTVYAMLDNCSEGTFITEEIAEALCKPPLKAIIPPPPDPAESGETEPKTEDVIAEEIAEIAQKLSESIKSTNISIKTLNGMSTHDSSSAEGLQVSSVYGFDDKPPEHFDLPKSYTRQLLPIERVNIPTVEKIHHFEYLRTILHEIPQFDQDIPIGLLIGGNCSKMIEPIKVIPSHEGGPYAFRTVLGWCISGSLHVPNTKYAETMICNRIAVQDVSTGKVSDHQLVIQEAFQDNKIHDVLFKMYQMEFVENHIELKAPSVEDKKFLQTMEQGAEKEGKHHKLPLPLRNEHVDLPNNRSVALKRIQPLKRRFERDPQFHRQYTKFMNGLLEKGVAKESVSNDDNSWFLPHHGVVKPNKPGKVRPVFDCGAKYMDKSLNKELLSGPDLTNLLLGVLLEVPIMADIESMFCQVLVTDKHRSFLKFLCVVAEW